MPVEMVCNALDSSRPSYYEYRQRRSHIDVERLALKGQVNRLFIKSRSSAGSRTIKGMLNDDGVVIGRFKVQRLMNELGLICKQPDPHAYKQATVERTDIPNHLARESTVDRPNQAWCGDITCAWSGQRWSYLAVVLDLYARRVVGWEQAWSTGESHVPVGPGKSVRQPSETLALSNDTKHEPARRLLG